MPSGHAAQAFAAATIVHREYRHRSPWYGAGAYAIATSVALFRMINDQHFNKEQIAVEVEGRTYYGCCEMCKAKLRDDSGSRTAKDPVSGKKVDKAKAVIGADAEGKVFYFENSDNLKRFKAGWKTPESQ